MCVCVSITKVHPYYFCDNFPNSTPIQTISGRKIAEKIWNKLTHDNFNNYSLCVASSHLKIKFQTVCDNDTVTEVVLFSLNHYKCQ